MAESSRKRTRPTLATFIPWKNTEGKEKIARPLYDKLKASIKENIGPFKVEPLPCCIHSVGTHTFAAVYALRDKIRIHFALDYKLESPRIDRFTRMLANRYLYSIDVEKEDEINRELIS